MEKFDCGCKVLDGTELEGRCPSCEDEVRVDALVIRTKIKLVDKRMYDDESWTATIENIWLPQSRIEINLPYPDDIEVGQEMFLTLSV